MKMTKEEKAKNEQLKAMARSILQGRGKDLVAVHDVMRDMKKVLIEMLYDEENTLVFQGTSIEVPIFKINLKNSKNDIKEN